MSSATTDGATTSSDARPTPAAPRTHARRPREERISSPQNASTPCARRGMRGLGSQQAQGHAPATLQASGVDQFFDYATFLWTDGGLLGHTELELDSDWMTPDNQGNVDLDFSLVSSATRPSESRAVRPTGQSLSPPAAPGDETALQGAEGDLLRYFVNSVVPPLLEVETQKKWNTMRHVLLSMATTSSMVRSAILAFASLLRCRRETPWMQTTQVHYQAASDELARAGENSDQDLVKYSKKRKDLLATLFFLCYIDILEERMDTTHANLKRAYEVFSLGHGSDFDPVEMQILSWIRLLDARAVSAGGDGLFLNDKDENLLVQPSPATADNPDDELTHPSNDIEDVLFELLYQPGHIFYQKVQSFMGRISKIDPWHRTRGTVEDETEVMNIAAAILKDLRALYDNRPKLMDHAVAGQLKAPHVSFEIAASVTRAFRAYLANFHASKVHLHRVAYKHLPLTVDTKDALVQIRLLAQLMVDEFSDSDAQLSPGQQNTASTGTETGQEGTLISGPLGQTSESLPVTLLWPLLMLGSEEKDPNEREWIRGQIIRMEKVASNARATAQVLEEVQRRQDLTNTRQDIRSVMHAVFSRDWAIV
ncbi:hypothetical protein MCOR27_004538 [Pyricularia oryzae]|uniref:Uncharacterized protein n=1 Tax=Pyricularia oryzae TaxID=318829 RepID=A0A4P7NPZ1_PYROR|nr:hypothetical protein MCOR01_002838 [Pyricularia oryzae]KAI6280755.1 hypothetical protein MCOR27_004538 [Pyricularia oryzae]KAI6314868.1 hypothetical protein MCOR34_004815 [Pyricularia oryzae]KAI6330831.1 hypothetical protein MCOR29_001773 [Pyricularia oryzae]KAI6354232.1 hypothetical protein MCOR31_011528 [Pyricularia oryzae]